MNATSTIPQTRPLLAGQKFILLTTFRKGGSGVSTPVTFAELGGKLYVVTGVTSGKVKRLRRSGTVALAPA